MMEADNNIEEVHSKLMYCLFSPNGQWQATTLAPDMPACIAMIKLMHKSGIGESYHELVKIRKFKILPVKVSMTKIIQTLNPQP